MAKSIVKEIIIILLLTLAIILILGVLLYRYTAYNKVLPEEVSYTTPEDVRTKEYVEGRRNPFASVENGQSATSGNQATGSQTTGGSSTSNTSSNNNSNTNTNTNDDRFFPDDGTK